MKPRSVGYVRRWVSCASLHGGSEIMEQLTLVETKEALRQPTSVRPMGSDSMPLS